jgi:hypothetical protein
VQSAEKAGLGYQTAIDAIDDILQNGPRALESTIANLPADFPMAIGQSIEKGFRSRLKQLDRDRALLQKSP